MTLKRAAAQPDQGRSERTVRGTAHDVAGPRDRGQPKVLVVDDEPDLLELLELTLSRMGLDTTRAQIGRRSHEPARRAGLRPVPDRHAAARRRGPCGRRAHHATRRSTFRSR